MAELRDTVRLSRIAANGIHLHVAEAGPPDGPLVFLLHGFPEFWYGWRNQIAPLAGIGCHVVVPDQRGYNLSDKPKGAGSYDLDLLTADILGLADHYGQKTFDVAGHDWGASVGWWLAGQNHRRVRRLAALNAPHPAVWLACDAGRSGAETEKQLCPVLSDALSCRNSWWASTASRHSERAFATAYGQGHLPRRTWNSIEGLVAARGDDRDDSLLSRDSEKAHGAGGKLQNHLSDPGDLGKARCTTQRPELAEASLRLCDDGRIVYLDQATHWAPHDEPERVTELLAGFFG